MAFTEPQKVVLRQLLGYPDLFRQHNPRLESAFDVIGSRPDTQAAVVNLIGDLADLDPKLVEVLDTAGLKRAEDVEWYPTASGKTSAPQEAIRSQGRMLIGRLSVLFAVPLGSDYYGEGGYQGDWFMGSSQQRSRGGMIPLG